MEQERRPRELVEKVKVDEEEFKEFEVMRKKMLKRLSEGTERRFSDMYKMLPEEEREKIKSGIKASDEFLKQKKKESLRSLEASDRDAAQWWERIKEDFRGLTEEEWKKREKTMEISEKEVKAAKKVADEMTEKELKMKELPSEERLKVLLKEMGLKDPHTLRGIVERLKEVGITEGIEKEILEEIERGLAKRKEIEEIVRFNEREIPLFIEIEGRLERERIRVKGMPSERDLIEWYKRIFIEKNLGKGAREEEVDYKELGHKRYKEAMDEVKRER